MLQSDTTFDGQYKLLKLLGRGGFSEVWLAEDEYIHLQVVLKVYAPGSGMDDDGIQTIGNEFKLMFNLSHPNLLDPRGFSVYNKMPYLVLPYCTKGSVLNLIGRMDEEQVWRFIAQVASGLAYLHERDIIHQDIKPDNILIDDNGSYQITDFGISTKARSTLRKSVLMGNNTGGTTAYMGPERFSREPDPVKASDIWSLGATVFELMTSNLPFGELGGGMQKNGAEIPLIKGDYSDKLKNIVEQMLALETWNRPTAEKLVEWCADQSKITINQTQAASSEPQEPPHSGHATQMMHNEPIAEPPQLQQQQPERNAAKVVWSVVGIVAAILLCTFIAGLVKLNSYNNAVNRFELVLNKATTEWDLEWNEKILIDIKAMENGAFNFMITPQSATLRHEIEAKRAMLSTSDNNITDKTSNIPTKKNTSENYYNSNERSDFGNSGFEGHNHPGLYPFVSERIVEYEELKHYNSQELKIMRNEIFARHGYIFRSGGEMEAYFKQQPWYQPRYSDVNKYITAIETENIKRIKMLESEK